ncbi:MAG: LptA/OstA family protein [candidate division WOR-3 bacterium]
MIIFILLLNTTPFRAQRVEIINQQGERIVHLSGNVEITQDTTEIICGEAQLNETKGMVVLKKDVQIKDKAGKIQADTAVYFFKEHFSILKGSVKLLFENQVIAADSLEYHGNRRFVEMFQNIVLEDMKNKIIAKGQKGWYDLNSEIGSLTSDAEIALSRNDKPPIVITAREFFLKTKENYCYGYDSVTALIDSIIIFCDTIAYDLKNGKGFMVHPRALEKKNELKGISGEFVLKDNTISYFKVQSGIASYWTADGTHNVVEGENINILFREGRAFWVEITGNSRGKLYLKENVGD